MEKNFLDKNFTFQCDINELQNTFLPILQQFSIDQLKITVDISQIQNPENFLSKFDPIGVGNENEEEGEEVLENEGDHSISLAIEPFNENEENNKRIMLDLPNDKYLISYYSRKSRKHDSPRVEQIANEKRLLIFENEQKKGKFKLIKYEKLNQIMLTDFDQVLSICKATIFRDYCKKNKVLLRGVKMANYYDLVVYGNYSESLKNFSSFFNKLPFDCAKAFEFRETDLSKEQENLINRYLIEEFESKVKSKIEKTDIIFELISHQNAKYNSNVFSFFFRGDNKNVEKIREYLLNKIDKMMAIKIKFKEAIEIKDISSIFDAPKYHISDKTIFFIDKAHTAISIVKKLEQFYKDSIENLQVITKKKLNLQSDIECLFDSSISTYKISKNYSEKLAVINECKTQIIGEFTNFLDFKQERLIENSWVKFPFGEFLILNLSSEESKQITMLFSNHSVHQILKLYDETKWNDYVKKREELKDQNAKQELTYIPIEEEGSIQSVLEKYDSFKLSAARFLKNESKKCAFLILYSIAKDPRIRYPSYLISVN